MIKSFKIMLIPNNKQKSKLFEYANVSRWAYNWAISEQIESYKNNKVFISDNDLRKKITKLKQSADYFWLYSVSNNVPKQAIKDACIAYKNFFKGFSEFPKFKTKKKSKMSFYQDPIKIKFTATHVKIEGFSNNKKKNKQKFNFVRLAEKNRVPYYKHVKYYNPRITFDGINWWISIGVDVSTKLETPKNTGIGIDLGIKNLAVCSDNFIYKNINKTYEVKRLENKRRRLQRQISNKYKKGESYKKTSNIIKLEKELLKTSQRLTHIRDNYLHQVTTEIVNREPMFIVVENLSVKDMSKNKSLSKYLQNQCFYKFIQILEYKCLHNNIKFIKADKWYPSSKTCSGCGEVNKLLQLSDRVWTCNKCETKHDRDYNASINLMKYGESIK